MQEAFNGKFKEQQSSTAAWLPVPTFKLNNNEPRPGTCVEDTHALSEQLVTFIRGHPLMDSAVSNDNGKPVFYRRDIMFTKIVVDIIEIDGIRYTVYFVGTNTGHVYKIVEWYPQGSLSGSETGSGLYGSGMDSLLNGNNGGPQVGASSTGANGAQSTLVEIIEATVPEPVRAMEISSRHKSLYVASDSQVKQINLLNCRQRHDSCVQCVRDPYCGWDRKHLECRHMSSASASMINLDQPTSNLIQDITNETPDLCHAVIKHKDVHVTWGQSVHLPCKFNGFIQESQDLQQILAGQQRQSGSMSIIAKQQQQQQQHNSVYGQQTGYQAASQLQQQQQVAADNLMGAQNPYAQLGQPHGLIQPTNYIQWYYHRRDNILSPGYPVLQRRDKFILAADQGLVILNANEPGWYQCRLGNQIIHSYNLIIDTSKYRYIIV